MNNMGFRYIVIMVNRGLLDDGIESMVFGIVRLQLWRGWERVVKGKEPIVHCD